jgi:hypoxanthine phosphoribosyltransferase
MKCKIVTFEEVYKMVRQVASKVKESNYHPTTIVGLARGGWIPARLLCDFMGVTDLISLKVEHWLETGRTKDEATIRYPLTANLKDKRLLIVDDIADTGKSLLAATSHLKMFDADAMKTATMQYLHSSKFTPDVYAEEVKEWTWFIYPWNWIEDTSTLIVRLMETDKGKIWSVLTLNNELEGLFEIKWDMGTLQYILEIMTERSQLEAVRGGHKLKEAKVVKL